MGCGEIGSCLEHPPIRGEHFDMRLCRRTRPFSIFEGGGGGGLGLLAGSPAWSLSLHPEEHLLVAFTSRRAGHGYTEEVRDLRSPRGVLLGQRRQLLELH